MIDKLYDLKKTQTDQKLMQKGQLQSKIDHIDTEVLLTQNKINTTGVQKYGAISDFTILAMHKNTMKLHIQKLEQQKKVYVSQLEGIVKEIIELQKEAEQYEYILSEEKKQRVLKVLKAEQEAADEYVQSKYISG
ncbi:hypothetical protein CP965_06870 [Halarcobacter mediterraneus]|uniref:Flagellar FliJ protein n=1 Tax=Halarcobacter mediterraneus TaxID=2023153 RepID=A0A4Q1B0C7_9BACT|nr:hypothetical protein [Halarcobacter mediterraneus]RXK13519.1 hypothetical protein CP965_06870 [Halarcobacter mediterraneus]